MSVKGVEMFDKLMDVLNISGSAKTMYESSLTIFEDKIRNYVDNVVIITDLPDVEKNKKLVDNYKKICVTDMIKNINVYKIGEEIIKITTKLENGPDICNSWINCSDTCLQELSKYVQYEMDTTLYMLNTISKSILNVNDVQILKLFISSFVLANDNFFTNKFDKDYEHIYILQMGGTIFREILDKNSQPNMKQEYDSKLIMGFGPSASGKTYWAKQIIAILSKTSNSYPKDFLTVDGGIHRETSIVYQMVVNMLDKTCVAGFKNLVSSNFINKLISGSIFDSGKVKKNLMKYLTYLKSVNNSIYSDKNDEFKISLYVPDTLSGCDKTTIVSGIGSCESVYKPYVDVTSDSNWTGLLIWQHKTGEDCDFSSGLKCIGCTQSGKQREKSEGKKYSNAFHKVSMVLGDQIIRNNCPGEKIKIHNSGSKNNQTTFVRLVETNEIKNNSEINYEKYLSQIGALYNVEVYDKQSYSLFTKPANNLFLRRLFNDPVQKKIMGSRVSSDDDPVKSAQLEAKRTFLVENFGPKNVTDELVQKTELDDE